MASNIRYVGLDERLQRRLNQAANLIYSSYDKVTADEWDGSPCDLLVVDPSAPGSENAISQAQAGHTPIIRVTEDDATSDHRTVSPTVKVADLTAMVRSVLKQSVTPETEGDSGLLRLASEPDLAGHDVDASYQARWLLIRPSSGQVFGYSQSELQELIYELTRTGWAFDQAGAMHVDDTAPLASMTLEAFYLLAADANKHALPAVPTSDFRLLRWPRLAEAATFEYPLHVAEALKEDDRTGGALAIERGLDPVDVTACLWAFRAAGVVAPVRELSDDKPRSGFFSQLLGHIRGDRASAIAS